jgi:hypothetical protein
MHDFTFWWFCLINEVPDKTSGPVVSTPTSHSVGHKFNFWARKSALQTDGFQSFQAIARIVCQRLTSQYVTVTYPTTGHYINYAAEDVIK